jgi:DNA-binding NarL/FixJ family response regulator
MKHAGPGASAAVRLQLTPAEVHVDVEDDGAGRGAEPGAAGGGLTGMRERIGAFGRDLAAAGLPPKVLILTTFDLDDYVYAGLRAGASGFLLKDTQPDDLVAAIRTIASGESVLAPGATTRLIRQFTAQQPGQPDGRRADQIRQALTDRELDVFLLIATGMSNGEIAANLQLSEGTVKVHVGRILAKLGLHDRVQAVVRAYESALISPGPLPPSQHRHLL